MASDMEREHALASFKAKLIESRDWEAKLKNLRLDIKGLQRDFDQTEENIKALQSVGQIIGEVLKQLDEERCASLPRTGNPGLLDPSPPQTLVCILTCCPSQSSSRRPPARDTWSDADRKSTGPR